MKIPFKSFYILVQTISICKHCSEKTVVYRDCVSTEATLLTDACRDTLAEESTYSIVVMDNNQKGVKVEIPKG